MKSRTPIFLTVFFVAMAVIALTSGGCRQSETAPRSSALPTPQSALRFSPAAVGAPIEGKPWISHVALADLDRDGLMDILACDDLKQAVVWLRQTSPGKFEETVLASGLTAPVHVEAVDFDGDGDLDLLVACMGEIFPNNDRIGSIVILENDGRQNFTAHVVADHIARVTDVRAGDFDGDGKLDLAVAQFGYIQGEVRWMKNLGAWRFESHVLLDLAGTVNVCVADLNGDGTLDLVAVVSQQSEEIYLFENDGRGNFTQKRIFASTNQDFGSSGISLCDLNRDGRLDILYTNGDGFDYAEPGKRPWHGVQWLENVGQGQFRFHRLGDLPGAYSPVGVDLDGDGAMDVVAVSGFNDWTKPGAASLVVFRNDGHMNFSREILAEAPTHLVTCAVGNLDGADQPPVIVTGGFHIYPPYDRMSRLVLWRADKP